jgi:hypothetical protein
MAEERALYWKVLYWRGLLARVSAEIELKAARKRTRTVRVSSAGCPSFGELGAASSYRGDGAVLLLSKEEHEVLDEGHR